MYMRTLSLVLRSLLYRCPRLECGKHERVTRESRGQPAWEIGSAAPSLAPDSKAAPSALLSGARLGAAEPISQAGWPRLSRVTRSCFPKDRSTRDSVRMYISCSLCGCLVRERPSSPIRTESGARLGAAEPISQAGWPRLSRVTRSCFPHSRRDSHSKAEGGTDRVRIAVREIAFACTYLARCADASFASARY
jgi:hypothetical protein